MNSDQNIRLMKWANQSIPTMISSLAQLNLCDIKYCLLRLATEYSVKIYSKNCAGGEKVNSTYRKVPGEDWHDSVTM